MTRPVQIITPDPTTTRGGVFFKGSNKGNTFKDTRFRGNSQATIISPHVGKNEQVGQRWDGCVFEGVRGFNTNLQRNMVIPKWNMRQYQVSDQVIQNCHFRSRVIEHHCYEDLDFEHGDVHILSNLIEHAWSQGLQFVGPWGRPGNAYEKKRADNAGNLIIKGNAIQYCGKYGDLTRRGLTRPAFALSVFKMVKHANVHITDNYLRSKTKQFHYSAGMARAYGAIMVEHAEQLYISGNVVEYAHPQDRPVIEVEKNKDALIEGNDFGRGKVAIIDPENLIWNNNQGEGRVILTEHGRRQDMGPITGHYEWVKGQIMVLEP